MYIIDYCVRVDKESEENKGSGYQEKVEESYDISTFSSLRNFYTVFHSGWLPYNPVIPFLVHI